MRERPPASSSLSRWLKSAREELPSDLLPRNDLVDEAGDGDLAPRADVVLPYGERDLDLDRERDTRRPAPKRLSRPLSRSRSRLRSLSPRLRLLSRPGEGDRLPGLLSLILVVLSRGRLAWSASHPGGGQTFRSPVDPAS